MKHGQNKDLLFKDNTILLKLFNVKITFTTLKSRPSPDGPQLLAKIPPILANFNNAPVM